MLIGVFISAMFHLFMVLLLSLMMMVVVGTLRMGSIVASLLKVKLVFLQYSMSYLIYDMCHEFTIVICYFIFTFQRYAINITYVR